MLHKSKGIGVGVGIKNLGGGTKVWKIKLRLTGECFKACSLLKNAEN